MSYECAGGSLKLKGVIDKKISKKKKSKSSKLSNSELVKGSIATNKPDFPNCNSNDNGSDSASEKAKIDDSKKINQNDLNLDTKLKIPAKTKAELAYERFNEKRIEEKILKRAEKSHKERVELYNKHLDSLSEYNDIPKVSWTK